MEYLGEIAAQSGEAGIDISFVYDRTKDKRNIRSGQELLSLLAEIDVESSDDAPLRKVVWDVLNGYLVEYKRWGILKRLNSPVQAPKPLNLIVVTDGCTEDREDVEAALIRAARELPRLDIPEFHVGVEFLQIGDDEQGTKWLRFLDDRLLGTYGIRDVRILPAVAMLSVLTA